MGMLPMWNGGLCGIAVFVERWFIQNMLRQIRKEDTQFMCQFNACRFVN